MATFPRLTLTSPRDLAAILRRRVSVHLLQTGTAQSGRLACPACDAGAGRWQLTALIDHLWRAHRWTRRRIARWLDGLEHVEAVEVEVWG